MAVFSASGITKSIVLGYNPSIKIEDWLQGRAN
jgi:hypothetical protein